MVTLRRSTLLAAGLGLTLSAVVAVPPAHAAGSPALGAYQLSSTDLLTGQAVRLTELAIRDNEDGGLTARQVNWGDGTTETLGGIVTEHRYATPGAYRVQVTLTDTDGTTEGGFTRGDTVRVAAVGGAFKLNGTSLWIGPEGGQSVTLEASGVPAGVTGVRIRWADGGESVLKNGRTRVAHEYTRVGSHRVTVALETAAGMSAERGIGTVTVRKDLVAPSMTVTTPAKPARSSSWRTVRGTIGDKGSGIQAGMYMFAQIRNGKEYYYDGAKWVRGNLVDADAFVIEPSAGGRWSVRIPQPAKGTLIIFYGAIDNVGNFYMPAPKVINLNR